MIKKESFISAGYDVDEVKKSAPLFSELGKYKWRDRPSFAINHEGKLLYCTFRCSSSYRGGGNCNCISHSPEDWEEVIDN